MHILTRWGFRTVRANRSRTITVILAVVSFFAFLTSSLFVTNALARASDVDNIGLYWYISEVVCDASFFAMSFMLFSCFSVTVDECRQDGRILKSCGATGRQIFRSLLLRALALDLGGAVLGIFLGVELSRQALYLATGNSDAFRTELLWFFWLARTRVYLSIGLLIVPLAMIAAFLFSRLPSRRKAHAPKRWLFRNTLERRVFGVGGVLGRLNSSKNIRSRAVFTLSFAMCLAAAAALGNMMHVLAQVQPFDRTCNVMIKFYSHSDDSPAQQKLDALLQTCRERGEIDHIATVRYTRYFNCYCVLDDDWLTDEARRLQTVRAGVFDPAEDRHSRTWCTPFAENGSRKQLLEISHVTFLDDDTFDRLARKCEIDTGENGILLYDPGWIGKTTEPMLRNTGSGRNVTLRFLPWSYDFTAYEKAREEGDSAALADRVRAADDDAFCKDVYLAGAVGADMVGTDPDIMALWIVPERMADTFADIAPFYYPERYDYSETDLFLQTPDHQAVCDLILDAFEGDTDCQTVKTSFGAGSKVVSSAGSFFRFDEPETAASSRLDVYDLHTQREDLASLLNSLPMLETILMLFTGSILIIGVLNTAHMNRLTRRREKAILDSVGMDSRQKTGMRLYESLRYALRGTFYGVLCFAVYYAIWYQYLATFLLRDNLSIETENPFHLTMLNPHIFRKYYILYFPTVLARNWWIFAAGAALIFLLLVLIDMFIDRRSRREDLIRILKDDF